MPDEDDSKDETVVNTPTTTDVGGPIGNVTDAVTKPLVGEQATENRPVTEVDED